MYNMGEHEVQMGTYLKFGIYSTGVMIHRLDHDV